MKTGWNERTHLTYCDLATSIYWTGWNVCWSTVLVTSVILWSQQFFDITLCSTLRHRPLLNEWFIRDESCDFCLSSFNVRLFLCHATKSWGHVVTDFVKQEQWKRWRGKRKLVLGISIVHGRFCRGPGLLLPRKWRLYMQNPAIWCILSRKWFAVPSIMRP